MPERSLLPLVVENFALQRHASLGRDGRKLQCKSVKQKNTSCELHLFELVEVRKYESNTHPSVCDVLLCLKEKLKVFLIKHVCILLHVCFANPLLADALMSHVLAGRSYKV